MSRSLPARLLIMSFGFCLMLALLLGAGVRQARGLEGEQTHLKPGPVVEKKIIDQSEEPVVQTSSLSLDPFFLIEEEAHRVRVRRVGVALEFSQPEMLKQVDPQNAKLREVVYDFLAAKEGDYSGLETKEQQKILAGVVNRCLGQEAVTAVKVDQNILLLQ